MNRIAATHTANAQDIRLIWDGSGMKRFEGWDQIKGLYEGYMAHPLPSGLKNSKEEAVVHVGNGSAWVVCDNTWKSTQEGKVNSFTNVQMAFLEKQQGKWKVAFNAFAPRPVPESIEGVYEYLAPSKGMAVIRNGKFVFLITGSDARSATNGNAGDYELVGNRIKNTITYHTDPKQIGTSFWWKVESWSGDTLTYALLDDQGQTTGGGRALRVSL
jgi:hypothetical protein